VKKGSHAARFAKPEGMASPLVVKKPSRFEVLKASGDRRLGEIEILHDRSDGRTVSLSEQHQDDFNRTFLA
jgi:hypothetical protein